MTNPLAPYHNPDARDWRSEPGESALTFHRSMPGYAPTRLIEVPELARELGVASVHVKEESARFGLPAFKMLGASYAISRVLSLRYAASTAALSLAELRAALAAHPPVELIAATDGNHGRAVARTARLLGLASRIFFPGDISPQAKAAIASEATRAIEVDHAYDAVVAVAREASEAAGDSAVLIQDTAWPGYEEIPAWIVAGYSTLLVEAGAQLAAPPDIVAVPTGVGSLLQAAVQHYRCGATHPSVLAVEPEAAAPVLASLHAGRMTSIETAPTIMAGLNCGTPSALAWPVLAAGLDRAVAVTDAEAARALGGLAAYGIDAGPCGAAGLAGIRALARHDRLDQRATVLLVSTEGRAANPLPEERS